MICDSCGARIPPAEVLQYPAAELRAAVEGGFEPGEHGFLRLGLPMQELIPNRQLLTATLTVLILAGQGGAWQLCHGCGRRAKLAAFKVRKR